jgi:hypothetical protein
VADGLALLKGPRRSCAPPEEVLKVVRFAQAHGVTPRIILLHDGAGGLHLSTGELAA